MSDRNYDRGYIYRADYNSRKTQNRAYRAERGVQYYYGSEAPVLEPRDPEERRRAPKTKQNARTYSAPRKVRTRRAQNRMNPAYVAFMMGIMGLMCLFLFNYLSLQAKVTSAVEEIASMESELSELKSDNDEALNAIESSISLDDIKYRAITGLGMSYADEDQIITYSSDAGDYVRQVTTPE